MKEENSITGYTDKELLREQIRNTVKLAEVGKRAHYKIGDVTVKVATGFIKWAMEKKSFDGWTSIWNTIYVVDKKYLYDVGLIVHEVHHIEQIKKDGKIVQPLKYLYYQIKYGYKKNPYEIDADKHRHD